MSRPKDDDSLLDFTRYIDEHTQSFVGRNWVFKAIDDWLSEAHSSRFFLLLGEPGCGKTAIASRLVQFSQDIVSPPEGMDILSPGFLSAYFFCSSQDGWISPNDFSESLASQLCHNCPMFSQAIIDENTHINVNSNVTVKKAEENTIIIGTYIHNVIVDAPNPREVFSQVVLRPLRAIYKRGFEKPITLLVDGLDETQNYGKNNILELLSSLRGLPQQIRFILASRPEGLVENMTSNINTLFLSSTIYNQENKSDITNYVEWRLKKDVSLSSKVTMIASDQISEAQKTIIQKSAGNFQYVTFLLEMK